jgi:integrase
METPPEHRDGHRRRNSRASGAVRVGVAAQPQRADHAVDVVEGRARARARREVPAFSTHTLRHLCLTDLAWSGWELHAIATFAGHRSTQTTLP